MKRILVTGAAGFVGHNTVKYIISNTDWEVVCLVRLSNKGYLKNLLPFDGNKRVHFVYHDLKFNINETAREDIGDVDYILHLAANSHVDRSIVHPKEFFEDNVLGTVNLLEYMRLYAPKSRMINFSTDEVYGPALRGYKYKEGDRFRPSNPYSASKAGQTVTGFAYFNTYGLDIINTFTVNIFGPNQNPEKLIPKAIKYAKEKKPMPVFAELKGRKMVSIGSRHWLDVRNAADAVIFLFKKGVKGEFYNISGKDEFTNEDVVKKINKLLGTKPLIQYVDFQKARPGHDIRYALDGTKLTKLGWKSKISFEEGIKNIIEKSK